MKWLTLIFNFIYFTAWSQMTPYEKNGKNYTATYEECISYYKQLAQTSKGIKIIEQGKTDCGQPLHLVLLSADGNFDPKQWQSQNKCVLLINNGIHPGEPDGIDASMLLARDLVQRIKKKELSSKIAIAIIPVYNIDGMLNRSAFYRIDQNGPEAFGSRGNAQNLDLNRDFIKCDSKNAQSFAEIFHFIKPHIFVDNHVSDGADYHYIMTMATTQKDKLGGILGEYLYQKMEPQLFKEMSAINFPMIPYVNVWGDDAIKGWPQFFDSPRYSSGYATLFNTIAFVPETHMLKPYPQRVAATLAFMNVLINYAIANAASLVELKKQSIKNMLAQSTFPIAWQNNKDSSTTFEYKGYAYKQKISEVSGLPFPYYDHDAPYTKNIPFYNHYKASAEVEAPLAYIIPQGWHKVITLLALNHISMIPLAKDSEIIVEQYRIESYKSSATPYEGHHSNNQIKVSSSIKKIKFRKGDLYIPANQNGKRFIVETLEPHGMDSYFTWNYFDAILNQKEGFTDYAYDDIAAAYLKTQPALQKKLVEKRNSDTTFAKDAIAQLDFVYKQSPYYEPQHNAYPICRITSTLAKKSSPAAEEIINKKDE